MTQIDYFFSTLSPFTYLAGMRLENIAKKHGAKVIYKPLDIMALFARTGGTPPKDRHPNRIEHRLQELRRQGVRTGLKINIKPAHWPTNMAPSSYAIIAAQNTGGDVGPLVHSFLRAVWAEEKDIADEAVIRAILADNGFDPELTNSGLLVGAETFGKNLEEAVEAGAFGAPTYIVGDNVLWGQDRLDDLDLILAGKL